jgi:hypothetical protein
VEARCNDAPVEVARRAPQPQGRCSGREAGAGMSREDSGEARAHERMNPVSQGIGERRRERTAGSARNGEGEAGMENR